MDDIDAKYDLIKGLISGYANGYINFEMVKKVIRNIKRVEKNREFLKTLDQKRKA